jgi:hypothetical protein
MASSESFTSIEKEVEYAFIPDDLEQDGQNPITRAEFCKISVTLYDYLKNKSSQQDIASLDTLLENPFSDTSDTYVIKAYSMGIISLSADGKFRPQDPLTLQEKAVMLYNTLLKLDPTLDADMDQQLDLTNADQISPWALKAINYLNTHDILVSNSDNNINSIDTINREDSHEITAKLVEHKLKLDGTLSSIEEELKYDFIPDQLEKNTSEYITREQFCEVIITLYEYLKQTSTDTPLNQTAISTVNPFSDTDNPYVIKAYALGLISGVNNDKFNPKDNITVQEKAVMLYNTLLLLDPKIASDIGRELNCADQEEISPWAIDAITYLNTHNILVIDENNELNPLDTIRTSESHEITAKAVDYQLTNENLLTNYLLFGYHVTASGPINAGEVNKRAPILDRVKLDATNYVQSSPLYASNILDTVSNKASEFYKELNVDAKVSYSGILYSGSITADYGVNSKMNEKEVLIKHVELHPVSEKILECTNEQIKELLSEGFKADLTKLTPKEIFDKYGTHLITRYSLGGRLDLNYKFTNVNNRSESDISVAAKASYAGSKGTVDVHTKELVDELVSNSKLVFRGIGGNGITGTSVDQLNSQYAEWVKTLDDKPDICYVNDFKNSMVPIWELVDDANISQALKDEFDSYVAGANSMINGYDFVYVPAPPTKQYIVDIIVVTDGNNANALAKIPTGYKTVCLNTKIGGDKNVERLEANSGAGGDFIYIAYLLGTDITKAIRDIKILEGGKSGYTKINIDLNRNAGGKYIYLNYSRTIGSPLTAISGYYGEKYSMPAGWSAPSSNMDLNKGAGGKYIYLMLKH